MIQQSHFWVNIGKNWVQGFNKIICMSTFIAILLKVAKMRENSNVY
jgi:hypothetical protein